MKNRRLKIALSCAAALTFGLGLVGCSNGGGDYDYLVTFDYNVGTDTTIVTQYLGVKENSLIVLQPGDRDSFKLGALEGYSFEGWYLPETDSDGNPVIDEETGRVVLGRPWDFSTDRVTGDLTLYGNFERKSTLTIIGVTEEDGETVEVPMNRELSWAREPGDTLNKPTVSTYIPSAEGYTFINYFEDEACTIPFAWPYEFKEGDETVYAKFLKGVWTILQTQDGEKILEGEWMVLQTKDGEKILEGDWVTVGTPAEFVSAIVANKSIYLEEDLDFTGASWTANRNYSGTLEGNEHTIANITCAWDGTRFDKTYGLFGMIDEKAVFRNVTIENVNIEFSAKISIGVGESYKVYLFARSIDEDVVFENFSFSGTLKVSRGSDAASTPIEVYAVSASFPENCRDVFDVEVVSDGSEYTTIK